MKKTEYMGDENIKGDIYGPVEEQGIWGIRTNHELRDTHKDSDIAGD